MSNFLKGTKTVVLKTIQLAVVRKQKEFMNPNKIRRYKIKGGSKISKKWENSCSCNNWRLPGEPRSLDNLFLK